uniref:NADH dehydrogenase subunit 5 n=1 Tax=Aphelenchoides medicagus TaxID=2306573 RepID=UPI001F130CE8|nr:NADH dehydrogenase subunit 5 [Aphelenchoides medicagus]UKS08877.1 NADH dehydrogenase subunit 5 [Aphelenchoides medicagus]
MSSNLFDWLFFDLVLNFYFSSLIFYFILMIVVFSIFLFTSFYLNSELKFVYFFVVLLIFILSMIFLNFSKSLLWVLVSWDLLGISSYFLVLFYNNWDSNIGSMNVALTNRLGDYFLFFLFSFFFCGSFILKNYSFFYWFLFLMVLLTGFTKSAQFPFSSWLPKAMSAPTPVSALVHSSTLVTAGLILMMNFSFILNLKFCSLILTFFGLFTLFFSSFMALLEQDMKKVVALSTLSQMGFSSLVLGLTLNFFCLFHLLSHALFKSCLFIQIGFLIYKSLGQQDGRFYMKLKFSSFFLQFQILLTLFCLCGLFFSSGLVSKDFILEYFFSLNLSFFFLLMFFFSVFFTFLYSFRLWSCLFSFSLSSMFYFSSSKLFYFISCFLVYFSIFLIWFLNKNMVFSPLYFLYVGLFTLIFYIFYFFFIFFLVFLFFSKILKSSFLVDFYAKVFSFFSLNLKFKDMFLNSFLFFFFLTLKNYSLKLNFIFLNFNIFIMMFFFLLFFLLF